MSMEILFITESCLQIDFCEAEVVTCKILKEHILYSEDEQ